MLSMEMSNSRVHGYATRAIRNRVPVSHSVTTQQNSPASPLTATPPRSPFLWTVSAPESQSSASRTTSPSTQPVSAVSISGAGILVGEIWLEPVHTVPLNDSQDRRAITLR